MGPEIPEYTSSILYMPHPGLEDYGFTVVIAVSYCWYLNPMAWDARCLWHWCDPESFFEIAEESSGLGYCAARRKKMTILTTWISHLFSFNVWNDWMFSSPSYWVIISAHWQGAPSCWKRHSSSPARSWMTGRSWLTGRFRNVPHWRATLRVNLLPRLRSKPTHEWSQDALVLHFQHRWWWGSPILAQTGFLSDASNNQTGDLLKKMTLPQSSAAQSLYLLQNISPSVVFFFFAALCVHMDSHMMSFLS